MLQPKKVGSYTIFLYFNLFFFVCVCWYVSSWRMLPRRRTKTWMFYWGDRIHQSWDSFFWNQPFFEWNSLLSQVVVRISTIVFRPLTMKKDWDTKNWYKNWIKGMNHLIGKSRERECRHLKTVCTCCEHFFLFQIKFCFIAAKSLMRMKFE